MIIRDEFVPVPDQSCWNRAGSEAALTRGGGDIGSIVARIHVLFIVNREERTSQGTKIKRKCEGMMSGT